MKQNGNITGSNIISNLLLNETKLSCQNPLILPRGEDSVNEEQRNTEVQWLCKQGKQLDLGLDTVGAAISIFDRVLTQTCVRSNMEDHPPKNIVESLENGCHESYMTPWATVIAMFALYLIALLWFCRHGKKVCLPSPDSIYPYKRRLKYLKTVLDHLLVDDMFIELTDSKLGQGAVGFVFKGYVFPKTQTRFKQKTFAAVKMSYPMPQKSIGLLEEAARMAKLNHPNIVKIIAVSKLSFTAFRPMFAMEWLPGGSLAEFFRDEIRRKDERERKTVYIREIIHVLRQVGEALKYIHESRDHEGNEFTHGDFGLPIDFGPRLPIPWLPPEIVCSLDRSPKHRPESDVWMFGVLGWECATLGAEPHFQRTFEEIQQSFGLPDRGLHCPPNCPMEFWSFLMDCLSEQHRRPRFSGLTDTATSAIYRLRQLETIYAHSNAKLNMVLNISNCTCSQHRCNIPLPPFTIR
uniref:Protein kinase domain-containing protein n=1 Tax=Panagrolaimus sp. PS1159 TaxID=55785 RepID=A0AC35F8T4_9BILA